jgi:hypothetical protein
MRDNLKLLNLIPTPIRPPRPPPPCPSNMYTARVPVEKKEEEEDKNTEKKFLGSHFHNWRL